jgi:predicted dehydrogenase
MYILGKEWSDGYLDYYRCEGRVRVAVSAWLVVSELGLVADLRRRDLRLVWNYLREFGFRTVKAKVLSRMRETVRDRQVMAAGLGHICESDDAAGLEEGTPVAFIAPRHPRCVERLVLHPGFVTGVDEELIAKAGVPGGIRWLGEGGDAVCEDGVAGWDDFSGAPVPRDALGRMLAKAVDFWRRCEAGAGRVLPVESRTPVRDRIRQSRPAPNRLSAVLFGLGNYAKINVMRWIDPGIDVQCVHEINPAQIGRAEEFGRSADTSPLLREDESYDIYFIAGYHHTHADLAVEALERGGWAVVTKPVVTTRDQFERLRVAIREHPGRFFACFNKRYNPLWELAREDMDLSPGDPVHYQCIIYEAALHPHHWYWWPNSGSRLLSNGCHWIDHFLFMNDFQPPQRYRVWRCSNGDVCANVDLVNGASFTMALTDKGSPRIGVQDHIEMRANDVTVRVDRAARYMAEGRRRILRKKRIRRLTENHLMYKQICRKILEGQGGETLESFETSSRLILDLEEEYQSG